MRPCTKMLGTKPETSKHMVSVGSYIAENLVKCKKKLFSSDSKFELQHLPQKNIHNNLLHLLRCLTLLQTAEFDWFDLGVAFLRSFKACNLFITAVASLG